MKYLIVILSLFISSCSAIRNVPNLDAFFGDKTTISLFDGESLGFWTPTTFSDNGAIGIQDSSIVLSRGAYLTGITWQGPVLRMDYELELDAKRIEGYDFFCGITFPFEQTYASLVLGGWGGFTTGISSINGIDASENGTADSILFEYNVWYHVRLRITTHHIEAWVDTQNIVDLDTSGKTISLRSDVDVSTPLSIMTFNTTGAVRNLTLKKL